MRIIAPFLAIIFISISCSETTEYTLNGTIDLEDGQNVLLLGVDEQSQLMPIDTVQIESGTFSLSGLSKYPEMHYLNFEGVRSLLPVVIEPGTITVEAKKDSIQKSSIKGTKSNQDVARFLKEVRIFNQTLQEISYELRNAMLSKDSLNVSDLQEQYDDIVVKIADFEINFIKENPDSYVSSLILEQRVTSEQIDITEAQDLFDQLDSRIQMTKSAQNILELLQQKELQKESNKETPGVGDVAPDFKAPSPNGELVTLNQAKGKFTVIDFWASWCKPCRNQSPALVELYNTYKSQDVNIVSVSLDRSNKRWLDA
ncbi:MAG: redoxin domain-containing protein, partial [Bacteroidota bacterium]|nr:redoxin domain-containing protein [Bacteroidota bacterium]